MFGKKKAKEECARLTLEYLREVHAARTRAAKELLRGMGGGEMVLGAAVGREVEGEREVVEGRLERGEIDVDGEDEEEFEDAVESLEGGK